MKREDDDYYDASSKVEGFPAGGVPSLNDPGHDLLKFRTRIDNTYVRARHLQSEELSKLFFSAEFLFVRLFVWLLPVFLKLNNKMPSSSSCTYKRNVRNDNMLACVLTIQQHKN